MKIRIEVYEVLASMQKVNLFTSNRFDLKLRFLLNFKTIPITFFPRVCSSKKCSYKCVTNYRTPLTKTQIRHVFALLTLHC